MPPILTDTVIAGALADAKRTACPPEGKRCSSWASSVEAALQTLTPEGWCAIAVVIDTRSYG